jgi:hypothetical protein
MDATISTISLPVLIYMGMGLVMARILVDKSKLDDPGWLCWLQFLVDAIRIVVLWPLVLFVEKLVSWLNPMTNEEAQHIL